MREVVLFRVCNRGQLPWAEQRLYQVLIICRKKDFAFSCLIFYATQFRCARSCCKTLRFHGSLATLNRRLKTENSWRFLALWKPLMVSPIVLNIACSESLTLLNLIFASATATTWRKKKYTKTASLLRAKQEKISFLEAQNAYYKLFSNYCPKWILLIILSTSPREFLKNMYSNRL